MPEMNLQGIKRGIMEMADMVLIKQIGRRKYRSGKDGCCLYKALPAFICRHRKELDSVLNISALQNRLDELQQQVDFYFCKQKLGF